ncbi:MAG: TadE/TadG family type IV pilus assembly protein, partial [Streptosporangiaceae bacterium]
LRRDERGAIAIVVAVLIGCGVLTGMAALVVDVGQLYQEHSELQNGADAAAIAVAKSCALGACDPLVVQQVALQYADGNASQLTGGTEGVGLICGSDTLPACPAPTGAPTDCPAPPPTGANYVDVHTSTEMASGSTLLPPVFAGSLLGAGYNGTTVKACAQAEWGPPPPTATATTTAITISACELDQATQQEASFPPVPPYPPDVPPAPSVDQVLRLNTPNGTGCATEPGGADGPGTFGWVAHTPGHCTELITGPTFAGRTRTTPSFSCQEALQNAQQNQTPILVPIYISQSGTPASYVLDGFAEFVVTGYYMPLNPPSTTFYADDWLDPANNCAGAEICLNGYFVQGVLPFTGTFGTTNLGVSVIDLTG